MRLSHSLLLVLTSISQLVLGGSSNGVSSYFNPVLPGWHSDPSCIQRHGTFYCVTSTFLAFPGLPVYASEDLIQWRLISHAWNRGSQLPGLSWSLSGQSDGMYAPTFRVHKGVFYVISVLYGTEGGNTGVLFKTTNPFNDQAWSIPVTFNASEIDPDLFWDDDGKVYMTTAGINLQEIDLHSGELSDPVRIWNGSGGDWPEGPHIYKKDGWYYLMIAEGGTMQDHSITIARATKITGPYESSENNPILTNRNTTEYYQSVGHGDLFQDKDGHWWGLCLAIRTGQDYQYMPMGREAVLFNVTWEKDQWPVLQPVRGVMANQNLPKPRSAPGNGPINTDNDDYTFSKRSLIPEHFIHHREPPARAFITSSKGLQITPSRNNLTGVPESASEIALTGQRGLSFIGRRQTHTLFNFNVDFEFQPKEEEQEVGISVFRTQMDHIELGMVRVAAGSSLRKNGSHLAFRVRAVGPISLPDFSLIAVPKEWESGKIRLQISATNATHYAFAAMPASSPQEKIEIAAITSEMVSGRSATGFYVGSLVGVYATCNGAGSGVKCPSGGIAYIKAWNYTAIAQEYDADAYYPAVDL